jgi:hypothetical protein
MIRAQLFPADGFNGRNELISKTQSYLLYPLEAGHNSYPTGTGYISGDCATNASPRYCNAKISMTTPILANTLYLLRLRAIYRPSFVTITADNGVQNILLKGAQSEVDATGQTTDVLRRIKVRVPSNGNIWAGSTNPEFAVETTDGLCKLLVTWPGGYRVDDTTNDQNCEVN